MPIDRFMALVGALALTFTSAAGVLAQAGPVGVDEPATYVGADRTERGIVTVTAVLDPFIGIPADQLPEPGTKVVVVTMIVEGTGADGVAIDPYSIWLRDSSGALRQPALGSAAVRADFKQPELTAATIGQGSRVSGHLAYVIPDDVSAQDVLFQPEPGVLLIMADQAGPRPGVGTAVPLTGTASSGVIGTIERVEDPYRRFKKSRPPATGGRFVMVATSFENTGATPFALERADLVLRDARGALWAPAPVKPRKKPTLITLDSVGLAPGDRVRGRVGYQLPADVALDGLYYQSPGRFVRLADLSGTRNEPSVAAASPSAG